MTTYTGFYLQRVKIMQTKLPVVTKLFNIAVNKLAPDAKKSARCKLDPVYSKLNVYAVTHPCHIKKFKSFRVYVSGASYSLPKKPKKTNCKIGKQMAMTLNLQENP